MLIHPYYPVYQLYKCSLARNWHTNLVSLSVCLWKWFIKSHIEPEFLLKLKRFQHLLMCLHLNLCCRGWICAFVCNRAASKIQLTFCLNTPLLSVCTNWANNSVHISSVNSFPPFFPPYCRIWQCYRMTGHQNCYLCVLWIMLLLYLWWREWTVLLPCVLDCFFCFSRYISFSLWSCSPPLICLQESQPCFPPSVPL